MTKRPAGAFASFCESRGTPPPYAAGHYFFAALRLPAANSVPETTYACHPFTESHTSAEAPRIAARPSSIPDGSSFTLSL